MKTQTLTPEKLYEKYTSLAKLLVEFTTKEAKYIADSYEVNTSPEFSISHMNVDTYLNDSSNKSLSFSACITIDNAHDNNSMKFLQKELKKFCNKDLGYKEYINDNDHPDGINIRDYSNSHKFSEFDITSRIIHSTISKSGYFYINMGYGNLH